MEDHSIGTEIHSSQVKLLRTSTQPCGPLNLMARTPAPLVNDILTATRRSNTPITLIDWVTLFKCEGVAQECRKSLVTARVTSPSQLLLPLLFAGYLPQSINVTRFNLDTHPRARGTSSYDHQLSTRERAHLTILSDPPHDTETLLLLSLSMHPPESAVWYISSQVYKVVQFASAQFEQSGSQDR